ncbi:MAG: MgtC/SapB family protein [Anaerolineales bacterium]
MLISPDDLNKLLLAVFIGGLIGFEREIHAKAAGLRTITLITLGAALFTMLSARFIDDRVVANIVTGVGFLGAGAILLSEGKIKGLTTASSIWVAAALGMAIGFGEFTLAIFSAGLVLLVLWLFTRLDRLVDVLGRDLRIYEVWTREKPGKLEEVEAAFGKFHLKIIRSRRKKSPGQIGGEWEVRGALKNHSQLMEMLLQDEDVLEIR